MKFIYFNLQKKQIRLWMSKPTVLLTVLIYLTLFIGCIHFVSYYDSITYINLTDLKGEMKVAFEEFSLRGASGENDLQTLKEFKIEIAKALEYESGKKLNDDTIAQFNILEKTIHEAIDRFKEHDNKLSAGYCDGKWKVLEKAFDIAIATERAKIVKK